MQKEYFEAIQTIRTQPRPVLQSEKRVYRVSDTVAVDFPGDLGVTLDQHDGEIMALLTHEGTNLGWMGVDVDEQGHVQLQELTDGPYRTGTGYGTDFLASSSQKQKAEKEIGEILQEMRKVADNIRERPSFQAKEAELKQNSLESKPDLGL